MNTQGTDEPLSTVRWIVLKERSFVIIDSVLNHIVTEIVFIIFWTSFLLNTQKELRDIGRTRDFVYHWSVEMGSSCAVGSKMRCDETWTTFFHRNLQAREETSRFPFPMAFHMRLHRKRFCIAAVQLKICHLSPMQRKFIVLWINSSLMLQRESRLHYLPDSILHDILSGPQICELLRAQLTSLAWHHTISSPEAFHHIFD